MIKIKTGISARHIHLTRKTLNILFGKNYQLNILKKLKQPNQYASKETVKVLNEDKCFEKIRILGPLRNIDQLEISITDCIKLGIKPIIRESGDISGTKGIKLIGPKGSIDIKRGVIVASRHIHLSKEFSEKNKIKNGQIVKVKTEGKRSLFFNNVKVRVSNNFVEEFHIDTDEANSAFILNDDLVIMII